MKTPPSNSTKLPTPILLTGAGGMLGSDLYEALALRIDPSKLIAATRQELDITDRDAVLRFLEKTQPHYVINAAAYTNVDGAESERNAAYQCNAIGPRNLAQACQVHGAALIHFSTDQVFDGNSTQPWKESNPTHPVNYYAQTKLEGEGPVLDYEKGLVLRVQWLYGHRKDRFTHLKNKAKFTPFADQVGSPTWTRDIASVVIQLIEKRATGLFHFAYDNSASWAEVYEYVVSKMDYATQLSPMNTDTLDLPAKRPKFAALSNEKLRATLGLPSLGNWQEPLSQFLSEHQDGNP